MKKTITTTAAAILSLAGFAFTAAAHDHDEDVSQQQQPVYDQPVYDQRGDDRRPDYGDHRTFEHRRHDGLGELQRDVDHMNGMMAHVDREMREYRAGRHIWSEYGHLRAEAAQLNNQFRRGEQYYDRRRLRAEIEHMHGELHHIEQELHVRAEGYYQWR
ncbi:MAG: hypothetical protein M3Z14_02810 [Candidatus Eremiobacteraeota bacterium]|nr:hypothetical protein [Candidatus Eremiobacteraeota bacterium]